VKYQIEIVLRDREDAVSGEMNAAASPREWTELDVEDVLRDILRAIDRAKNPGASADRQVTLRGFSWIVEPADGGVVIAIEIPMGAAVAGPFDADPGQLDALITRILKRQTFGPSSPTIH